MLFWAGINVYRRAVPRFRGFDYLGTLHLKVVSVCHLGPAGYHCTMWGIIDLWSQWSVPSAVHWSGPDGAFSPGPAVINVSSRWKTMPQPSSSPHPLGDTCLHCTIHRLHFYMHKNMMIKNSGHSDRQIKNISVLFGHTKRIWKFEHSHIFTLHFPDVIHYLLSASSPQWRSVPSVCYLVNMSHMELYQLLLLTVCVIINIWGCDDSLRWEVSCSVGGLLSDYLCSGNWLLDLTRRTMSQLCQGQQGS